MQMIVWVRYPYPFMVSEQRAIEQALHKSYPITSVTYHTDWPVHFVCFKIDAAAQSGQVAQGVRVLHRMQQLMAYERGQVVPAQLAEVEARRLASGRPDWAREEEHELSS